MVRQRSGATHTFAILELSASAFDEIKTKLQAAGYLLGDKIDGRNIIDMHGIAVAKETDGKDETAATRAERADEGCEGSRRPR